MLFRLLGGLASLAILSVVAWGAIQILPAFGEASATALAYSVTEEVGGTLLLDVNPCEAGDSRDSWRCYVVDTQGSGGATYEVTRDGNCWTADRAKAGVEGPPLASVGVGCIGLRDQVRLFHVLLGLD